jgi:NAD/NADP transhydrogenase beta subunit
MNVDAPGIIVPTTIVGALIASSGSILSYIMCTSMKRSLANFILGSVSTKSKVKSTVAAGEKPILEHSEATIATVFDALTTAKCVTIVPGLKLFVSAPSSLHKGAASGGNCAHTIHYFCSRDQLAEMMTKINDHKMRAGQ